MPVRVLHLIGGGEIGGAEQNVLNLLVGFPHNRINPYLGCLIKNSPFATLAGSRGINTAVFPMIYPLDLFPLLPLIRYCRHNKIELLHCHGTRANLLGRIAAKYLGLPCISTLHSLPEKDYSSAWAGSFASYLGRLTLPLSSGLITVSKSLIPESQGFHLPVKTIYNGCEFHDYSQKDSLRSAFRDRFNIPGECTVIGTIGRLHPVKGQAFLIEAFNYLVKEFSDLHLILIGEGPLHSELQDLLDSYQLPYTMTGYLPDAWKAIPAMDLFVLPSLNEGMGLVLLEAAQTGIPIVASNVGGIPELLTNNFDALLVKPADPSELTVSISKILRDNCLAQKLTANARNTAKHFSIDRMVDETVNFYEQILAK